MGIEDQAPRNARWGLVFGDDTCNLEAGISVVARISSDLENEVWNVECGDRDKCSESSSLETQCVFCALQPQAHFVIKHT